MFLLSSSFTSLGSASAVSWLPQDSMTPDSALPDGAQNSINQQIQVDEENLVKIHLPFIQNRGQVDSAVKFYVNTFAGTAFVTDDSITYSLYNGTYKEGNLKGVAIKEKFLGAPLEPTGQEKSQSVVNYFVGDRSDWKSNLPTYDGVSLGSVWPDIDVSLKAYGNNLEKIFTVRPGVAVNNIRVGLDGIVALNLGDDGTLLVKTDLGTVSMSKPVAFQYIDGIRKDVQVSYWINGQTYGFIAGSYDSGHDLIIDPLLASTFLGGVAQTSASAIALDGSGNVYVTGYTYSPDFPTTAGAYDTTSNAGLAEVNFFVSKLNSDLSSLLASTFLGATGSGGVSAIALDGLGNVYVTGTTDLPDFPTTAGAYDTTYNGGIGKNDIFVSKLNSDLSSLLASTFLGAADFDNPSAIAVDGSGNVYVTGTTWSSDFPTTAGAYDTTFTPGFIVATDVFVLKLNSDLSSLLASTFLGGQHDERAYAIAVDGLGNVYVTGETSSCNCEGETPFPTTAGAYDATFNGGLNSPSVSVFVSKLNSDLSSLPASTLIGGASGAGFVFAGAIALDGSDNVYVAGYVSSPDYPTTAGAYDTTFNAGPFVSPNYYKNVFVSKLNSDLSLLPASTFLGGTHDTGLTGTERIGIALDGLSNVYVTGTTWSSDFPTTVSAYDTILNDGAGDGDVNDVFVSKLNSDLSSLPTSTFLGAASYENAGAIALDGLSNVYVTGITGSSDFPTTAGAYDTTRNSPEGDAFVSKLDSNLSSSEIFCGRLIAQFDHVITGNVNNNILIGTSGDDLIRGLGGDDRIWGKGGNDCIDGGEGADYIVGGAGNDEIDGENGNDKIWGQSGMDILYGWFGNDRIVGGADNDSIFGEADNDYLWGQAGDDTLDGGTETDACSGGVDIDAASSCESVSGVP